MMRNYRAPDLSRGYCYFYLLKPISIYNIAEVSGGRGWVFVKEDVVNGIPKNQAIAYLIVNKLLNKIIIILFSYSFDHSINN